MNRLAGIWVCASAGMAVFGILTIPSWLFGSMNRSLLWRLRDRAYDARRRGLLPNSPTVADFIVQLEGFIAVLPKVSALQIWWFRRRHLGLMAATDVGVWDATVDDEGEEAQTLFAQMQDEVGRLVLRQYLVGSWSGLLLSAWRHPRILAEVLRPRRRPARAEHWRECEAVVAVEQFVPHVTPPDRRDLIRTG